MANFTSTIDAIDSSLKIHAARRANTNSGRFVIQIFVYKAKLNGIYKLDKSQYDLTT